MKSARSAGSVCVSLFLRPPIHHGVNIILLPRDCADCSCCSFIHRLSFFGFVYVHVVVVVLVATVSYSLISKRLIWWSSAWTSCTCTSAARFSCLCLLDAKAPAVAAAASRRINPLVESWRKKEKNVAATESSYRCAAACRNGEPNESRPAASQSRDGTLNTDVLTCWFCYCLLLLHRANKREQKTRSKRLSCLHSSSSFFSSPSPFCFT